MIARQSEGLTQAFDASRLAGLAGEKSPQDPGNQSGFYIYPFLTLGSRDSTVNRTGFDYSTVGFNTGVYRWLQDDLLLGVSAEYGHTGSRFTENGGDIEADVFPLSVYAAYMPESFYAYGSLGYALNLFSMERKMRFGDLYRTANSTTYGHQINTYGEVGYDFKFRSAIFTPMVSLAYSHLWMNGFSESGAGELDLNVDSQEVDSLQSSVGLKIAAVLNHGPVNIIPQLYAAYKHEFADGSRPLAADLGHTGAALHIRTDASDEDFAVVGTGIDIISDKHYRVALDFNAEVGRSDSNAQSVFVGVQWEF